MPADVNKIFEAAGLPLQDLRVGDTAAMLKNCERYVNCLQNGGPWKSYVELEKERDNLLEIAKYFEKNYPTDPYWSVAATELAKQGELT